MAEKDTESHPIDPPLEVVIPGHSEASKFFTWEEFTDFLETEKTAWEWLSERNLKQLPDPLGKTANQFLSNLTNLKNWSEQIVTQPEHPETKARQDNISNKLQQYEHGQLVCSKSPDGQYIVSLGKTDPKAALGALAMLSPQQLPMHQSVWREVMRGATLLAVSRFDKRGAVARATKALEDLRTEWETRFDEEKSSLEELRREVRTELNTTRDDITTAQNRVSKFWVSQGNKTKKFFRQARSRMKDMETLFNEHMRLKAPAKYWRNKAVAHLCWAIGAFSAFAISTAVAGWFLVDHATEVLALLKPARDGDFPWGNIAIISLPALAFFWFLRFIARVFVTNLQRQQDARERATMVQTYLALIQEGENVAKADERILILNALFRPGPGDAPDMAPPADLLDIIKRRTKD